jgi:hypothetical protein
MTNMKSKNKASTNAKHINESQSRSQKKSTIKSSIAVSRALTAASFSQGPLRHVIVKLSEDDDDNEASHIGSTLDSDGDTMMDPADSLDRLDNGNEKDEDEESEMSETHPALKLVSCDADN